MSPDVADADVFSPSYNALCNDMQTRGGGIALLIRRTLKYEPLQSLHGCENVWCRLFMNEIPLIVGTIYRPPVSSVEVFDRLNDHLSNVTNSRSRIILAGDFNLPGVDWDARNPGSLDKLHAESMFETMLKYV